MPEIVLGNGKTLIGIDENAQLRDLYFPYVGLENHVGGNNRHRIGVWVDGKMMWTDDEAWRISVRAGDETMAGDTVAINESIGIELNIEDVLYNEKDIFLRQIRVKNLWDNKRLVKIFFAHEFEIYESRRGDTGYYDPIKNAIVHYKGRRVFLINVKCKDKGFDEYNIGLFGIEGKEGSYLDASDGQLSKNAIEHGKVDSVIGLYEEIEGKSDVVVEYWIAIAKTLKEVEELNEYVLDRGVSYLVKTTKDFWHAWLNNRDFNFFNLDKSIIDEFKKSLLILRAHVDDNGSILASGDSTLLQYGRDAYCYMWPRDGALSAVALDKAGDYNVSRRFFEFCNDVLTKDGYFMQKFRPDKSPGSTWHSWVYKDRVQYPIQEDETALVIYSLWKHYEFSKDLEFIESIYNSLIKKSADFMVDYINADSGLPKPSYDLWEEKLGISTFTASSVYGALIVSSNFSRLLGKAEGEQKYKATADRMRDGILKYLWDEERKMFVKNINFEDGQMQIDRTLDFSSIYGVIRFRVLDVDDEKVKMSIETMEEIAKRIPIGGMMRHENDAYYRQKDDLPGNPWIITTLWLAQYYILKAKNENDFSKVNEILKWVVERAGSTGILPEQVDPCNGSHLSATPLTWSHSEFVNTVINYLEKLEELDILVQEEIKGDSL